MDFCPTAELVTSLDAVAADLRHRIGTGAEVALFAIADGPPYLITTAAPRPKQGDPIRLPYRAGIRGQGVLAVVETDDAALLTGREPLFLEVAERCAALLRQDLADHADDEYRRASESRRSSRRRR